MRSTLALLFVAASLSVWPPRVAAWNEVGHAVIARIAYDQLAMENPNTQLRLLEMLKKHPHYNQFLAKNKPADANPAEWALLRASNWPDWVRPPFKKGDQADPQTVRFHRGFDHFINRPVVTPTGPNAFVGTVPSFDPDRPDILSAFRQRMGELNEPLGAAEDKAVALCWIAHLIGDIHQPLHAGTQFSKQFPDGDLGGNLFGVKIAGRPVRLHTYWDNLLGEVAGWEKDTPEHQNQVYALVVKVTESLRDPQYSRAALEAALVKNPNFADWVEESHELAKTVGYRNGDKLLDAVALKWGGPVPEDAPEAGAGYDQRAQDVARRRAVLAGYRLADKLKLILSRQPAN